MTGTCIAMRLIEHHDQITLINGEGSPRRRIMIEAGFVLALATGLVAWNASLMMHGWQWGWIALLIVPLVLVVCIRHWRRVAHATIEVDRRHGRLRIERRFLDRRTEEVVRLDDVSALALDRSRARSRQAGFQPVLHMKDGRRIELGPRNPDLGMLQRAIDALGPTDRTR